MNDTAFALVTGASRGIGAAVVRELLQRGWDVVGVSRSRTDATRERERYRHVALDLADLAAVQEFVDGPLRDLARFDERPRVGLVNNAALLEPVGPLSRVDLERLDTALRVNTTVPTWLAGRFAAACPRVPCRIVSLSSGAATSAYPGWGAYCATKAALRMTDEVLAVELEEYEELAGRDLRVFTYAPGVVATAMQESIRATSLDDFPRRAKFEDLHANDQLADPTAPAVEIADRLESGAGPAHETARLGG